jgi:hypothetical protein
MKKFVLIVSIFALPSVADAQYYGSQQHQNPYQTPSYQQPSYGSQNNTYGNTNSNSHYVAPHTNNNGTYVQPHYQTNPNNTQTDNYSTYGNTNPHTGVQGHRRPQY